MAHRLMRAPLPAPLVTACGGHIVRSHPGEVSGQQIAVRGKEISPGAGALVGLYSDADETYLEIGNPGIGCAINTGSASTFYIFDDTLGAGMATTTSAANMVIFNTTGEVKRSTSSRRYKRDIAPAEVDVEAALKLIPRAFRSKAEVESEGDEAPLRVGFIAEEAADLGLAQWVDYDKDGPESFSYPLWVVALQAIVRDQQARIEALEARVAALEPPTG